MDIKVLGAFYDELRELIKDSEHLVFGLTEFYTKICNTFDKKYLFDINKYPMINFNIQYSEIDDFFNEDFEFSEQFENELIRNPLAKLLYSVLWKNGDLLKVKHIAEGIKDGKKIDSRREKALVFYQFGRHLSNPNQQPIVDQHTIRAFILLQGGFGESVESEYQYNQMFKYDKVTAGDLRDYLHWIEKIFINEMNNNELLAVFDKILFIIGKTAKDLAKRNDAMS